MENDAVGHQLPTDVKIAQIGKIPFVDDPKLPGFQVNRLDGYGLGDFLMLVYGRLGRLVWSDETVDAEIGIVDLVTKIATVGPVFLALSVDFS